MPCNSTVTTVSVTVSAGGPDSLSCSGSNAGTNSRSKRATGSATATSCATGPSTRAIPTVHRSTTSTYSPHSTTDWVKEGIRSAPSAAAQQRMEQEAARHTLRRLNKMLDKGKIPADTLLLLTLPRDSAGNIPIDSTTIEAVRLYQTAPSVPDTLQGKPQSDTLQTPQPTGSNKRKSQPGSTAPTNGTAPATGNGQANNAIPTNTATAGNGPCSKTGKPRNRNFGKIFVPGYHRGKFSRRDTAIVLSAQPFPGEKDPNPRNRPDRVLTMAWETAVLSAS